MVFWTRYPLLRLFGATCAGILAAYYYPEPTLLPGIGILALGLLILAGTLAFRHYGHPFQHSRWRGAGLILLFLGLAWLSTQFFRGTWHSQHLKQQSYRSGLWAMEVRDFPLRKERSIAVPVTILARRQKELVAYPRGRALLYLKPSPEAEALRYGDRIVFQGRLECPESPPNPQQFDYAAFLAKKGTYFTAYAKDQQWRRVAVGESSFKRGILQWRRYLLAKVDSWDLNPANEPIAKALLLGYKEELAPELRDSFASAGAMHVLAVSGLHVGIVYLLLHYLSWFLARHRSTRILQQILIVFILWGFALLTGFSASVVRAVVMFTFVALGRCLERKTSVYNAILASALFLLLLRPSYLLEAGFQLSYAAVFAIVWLQAYLQRPLLSRWKGLDAITALATVSIAAQLGTFPLALYYFHKLPGLFLLANWLVIPLVTLLMYTGIPLLVISAATSLPPIIYRAFDYLLTGLRGSVEWLGSFSTWVWQDVHLELGEVFLCYAAVWLTLFGWRFHRGWVLTTGLGAACILIALQLSDSRDRQAKVQFTAYQMKKSVPTWGLYHGNRGVVWADSSVWNSEKAVDYYLRPHWQAMNITELKKKYLKDSVPQWSWIERRKYIIQVAGKTFWWHHKPPPPEICADVWLLSEDAIPPQAQPCLPEKIVDMGLWNSSAEKWKKFSARHKLKFYPKEGKAATWSWPLPDAAREGFFAFL